MRVLMLSIDKTLLGDQIKGKYGLQGDTIKRHIKYGELVDSLDIIVTSKPGFRTEKLSNNVTVYPTNASTPWGHLISVLRYAKSFIQHEGVDLVVAQDFTASAAWLIRRKYRIPYIVTAHGADMESADWQSKKTDILLKPLIKYAIKQADGLRVVSPAIKEYFQNLGVSCPIAVIPTPTDYKIFSNLKSDKVERIRDKYKVEHVILTDGRLEPVKDYPVLFGAVKNLKQDFKDTFKLLIIGSGSLDSKLKQVVYEFDLVDHVVFLGAMPFEEVISYYPACDVFVLSSDSESLGKVLLQAGAAGKPVVATRTVGAKSIVRDGETGFLVDVGNAEQMSEKVSLLLRDEALRDRMGQAAQEYVLANYDSGKNIEKLVNFWQELAGKEKNYN